MNGRVYIHDTLPIEGGARGKMIELIRSRWGPHLEHTHGVRLVGVWATVRTGSSTSPAASERRPSGWPRGDTP